MKIHLILSFVFFATKAYGQNEMTSRMSQELSYEHKIAQKACNYLSKMDSVPDARQAIITSISRATDTVHLENVEKKYRRDRTVEGIRGLNKRVTDLLIQHCEIISTENR